VSSGRDRVERRLHRTRRRTVRRRCLRQLDAHSNRLQQPERDGKQDDAYRGEPSIVAVLTEKTSHACPIGA
jgi:hypothetical protein